MGLTRYASKTFDDARKPLFHYPTMTNIGHRIKAARARAGVTQQWLATRVGVSRAAVAQWERETDPTVPEHDRILKVAEALGVSAAFLITGEGEDGPLLDASPARRADAAPFDPVPMPAPAELRPGLPVYGVAACHNSHGHEAFEMQGEVIDRVKYPPALTNVPGAYAIYATGDSMEPRYFAGELVYVHPGKPPTPGSFVVVQLHPDHEGGPIRAMIKRLVRRSPSKVTLAQYNPQEEFDLQWDEIRAIHRILNGEELF